MPRIDLSEVDYLDVLEIRARRAAETEDYETALAALQQYREMLDAVLQNLRPSRHREVLERASAFFVWTREMTLIHRSRYLSQLKALHNTASYADSLSDHIPGQRWRAKF